MGEQWHVAEDIVEDVGLLEIVELVGPADETTGDEHAVGEVTEETVLGNESGHGAHPPAGQRAQLLGQLLEIGDAARAQLQPLEPGQHLGRGTPTQQRGLPRIQLVPYRMLGRRVVVPALGNEMVHRDMLAPAHGPDAQPAIFRVVFPSAVRNQIA
jgi:hypothetical protein